VTGEIRHASIERSRGRGFTLVAGVLAIGETKAVPVTRALVAAGGNAPADVVLVDAPPGTSCPVIEAVRGSDVVVLVTEPTPFGLNDLRLAVDMVSALGLRALVAVNRSGLGDDRVRRYCDEEGLDIVLELPDDRRVAEAYSRGEVLVDAFPDVRARLKRAWDGIVSTVVEGERP
jgi:MinD superfamily P-loop ATPase